MEYSTIIGYVNASNFIEKQPNKDQDKIKSRIITFDLDPNGLADTKGVAEHFELLPCDDLPYCFE